MIVLQRPGSPVQGKALGGVRILNTGSAERWDIVRASIPLKRGELRAGQSLSIDGTGTGRIERCSWRRWTIPYSDGSERRVQITFPARVPAYAGTYPHGSLLAQVETGNRGALDPFSPPQPVLDGLAGLRMVAILGALEINLYPATSPELVYQDAHRAIYKVFGRWPNTPCWASLHLMVLSGAEAYHTPFLVQYGCSDPTWDETRDPESTVMVYAKAMAGTHSTYRQLGQPLPAGTIALATRGASPVLDHREINQRYPDPDDGFPNGERQAGHWLQVIDANDLQIANNGTLSPFNRIIKDGQSRFVAGHLLWEPQPIDTPDQTWQAIRTGHLTACSTRNAEIQESCGPLGWIPRFPTTWFPGGEQERHRNANDLAIQAEQAWRRARQSYWQWPANGFPEFRWIWASFDRVGALARWRPPSRTQVSGEDHAWGIDGLYDVMQNGWPRILATAINSQLQYGWPVHRREVDGRLLTVADHPRTYFWQGHMWAGNSGYREPVSDYGFDQLGKDDHQYHGKWWSQDGESRSEESGWEGKDDQHDNDRYMMTLASLSGDDWYREVLAVEAARWCFEYPSVQVVEGHNCEAVHVSGGAAVRNFQSLGGRALGRSFLTAAGVYFATGDDLLRKRMIGRTRMFLRAWDDLGNPAGSARDIEGVYNEGPNNNALPLYPSWTTWFDAIGVIGLAAMHSVLPDARLLDAAKRLARACCLWGWWVIPALHPTDYQLISAVRLYGTGSGGSFRPDWRALNPAQMENYSGNTREVHVQNIFRYWVLGAILLGEEWAKTWHGGTPDHEWHAKARAIRRQVIGSYPLSPSPANMRAPEVNGTLPWIGVVNDPLAKP